MVNRPRGCSTSRPRYTPEAPTVSRPVSSVRGEESALTETQRGERLGSGPSARLGGAAEPAAERPTARLVALAFALSLLPSCGGEESSLWEVPSPLPLVCDPYAAACVEDSPYSSWNCVTFYDTHGGIHTSWYPLTLPVDYSGCAFVCRYISFSCTGDCETRPTGWLTVECPHRKSPGVAGQRPVGVP
jgi:hypothetical protein